MCIVQGATVPVILHSQPVTCAEPCPLWLCAYVVPVRRPRSPLRTPTIMFPVPYRKCIPRSQPSHGPVWLCSFLPWTAGPGDFPWLPYVCHPLATMIQSKSSPSPPVQNSMKRCTDQFWSLPCWMVALTRATFNLLRYGVQLLFVEKQWRS